MNLLLIADDAELVKHLDRIYDYILYINSNSLNSDKNIDILTEILKFKNKVEDIDLILIDYRYIHYIDLLHNITINLINTPYILLLINSSDLAVFLASKNSTIVSEFILKPYSYEYVSNKLDFWYSKISRRGQKKPELVQNLPVLLGRVQQYTAFVRVLIESDTSVNQKIKLYVVMMQWYLLIFIVEYETWSEQKVATFFKQQEKLVSLFNAKLVIRANTSLNSLENKHYIDILRIVALLIKHQVGKHRIEVDIERNENRISIISPVNTTWSDSQEKQIIDNIKFSQIISINFNQEILDSHSNICIDYYI